jgi:ribosomal protein S18 acetylase RimI-like enzyme
VYQTRRLTDKSEILTYLETDRRYAAYAIGDLEAGLFEQCTWVGAERAGQLHALALLYRGLDPPALFMMGETGGLRAILADALRPERAYLTCRKEHLSMARDVYAWHKTSPMWRMVLQRERFRPVGDDCVQIAPAHSEQLTALFVHGGGLAFSPAQVAAGVFYGIIVEEQVVAVAGTHLVSPTYSVAAVGNVFTHPDHRRRGYGTAATSAVVSELLRRDMGDIVLNVGQDNAAAQHIYEHLGFARYCPFLEGPASAR